QARQVVVHIRIARRLLGIRSDDQVHFMAARHQRVARLDRLNPVGALERKPDVGDVGDVHENGQWAMGDGKWAAASYSLASSRFTPRPASSWSDSTTRDRRRSGTRARGQGAGW